MHMCMYQDLYMPHCVSLCLLSESLAYSCYLKLMATQRELFPPEVGMNTRMTNLRELLEVGRRREGGGEVRGEGEVGGEGEKVGGEREWEVGGEREG